MIRAVLFDLDDTLYTSFDELNEQSYDAIGAWGAKNLGVPAAEFRAAADKWRRYYHKHLPGEPESHDRVLPMQSVLEEFGANPVLYAEALDEVYWRTLIDHMVLRPGIPELLDELRGMGLRTCVCTNMMINRQMEKIRKLGLAGRFDAFVASEEVGKDKPAPPIFLRCLEKCGCKPEEAIMVGDNPEHDVLGAVSVGIHGVWLNWTCQPETVCTCPHYTAEDVRGVRERIFEIIKKEGI